MNITANELFLKTTEIPRYWDSLASLLNKAQTEKRLGKMLQIALKEAEERHGKEWTYHIFNLINEDGEQWAVNSLKKFINELLNGESTNSNTIKPKTIQYLCDLVGKYNHWDETKYRDYCTFVYSDIITDASCIEI